MCQAGKGSWSFFCSKCNPSSAFSELAFKHVILLDLNCNFYYARNLYVRNHGTLPCDNLLTQQSLKGEGNTCQNYSHLMAEKA